MTSHPHFDEDGMTATFTRAYNSTANCCAHTDNAMGSCGGTSRAMLLGGHTEQSVTLTLRTSHGAS
jgi:hypothetical protein